MGESRTPIVSVLVANRGEIAVRVIRAAKDFGIATVAVYADSDRSAPFVGLADQAFSLNGDSPVDTYLCGQKLIDAAILSGANALHPGYGFLSEDADFAQAVGEAGLIWIGPPPQAIRVLGNKVTAREIAAQVGAPLVPGTQGPLNDVDELEAFVEEWGLPVVIKAAFGGGGRGMRVVRLREELAYKFESARREATLAFGRGDCFVERYLENPRHVEAQILADHYGNLVMVGTRDCTLQRRHQKVVEEAPAPFLTPFQCQLISTTAKAICSAGGYVGAGTVEFLVAGDGKVYFLEVNTRLQVEHPVTEETTGVDLVCEQFRLAAGERLRWNEDLTSRGHSLEFRINAEDPGNGFLPSPGLISRVTFPSGPGVRVDAGIESGSFVDGRFDSLLAKLIVTGENRSAALRRARRALGEFSVDGVATLLPLHRAIVDDSDFSSEQVDTFLVHTGWIESSFMQGHVFLREVANSRIRDVSIAVGGRQLSVHLPEGVDLGRIARSDRGRTTANRSRSEDAVISPMQGTVVSVAVSEGQVVEEGDLIVVVEAMKMENGVFAHKGGVVSEVFVQPGQSLRQGIVMCRIKEELGGDARATTS